MLLPPEQPLQAMCSLWTSRRFLPARQGQRLAERASFGSHSPGAHVLHESGHSSDLDLGLCSLMVTVHSCSQIGLRR